MASFDEATCFICTSQRSFLEEPCVLNCGHWFCVKCINEAVSAKETPTCPQCRVVIPIVIYGKSLMVLKLLEQIKLTCSEKCGFTGDINAMKSHICANMILPCPYEGCNKPISGSDYEKHLLDCEERPKPCEWCGELLARLNRKAHLTTKCTKNYVIHDQKYCHQRVLACDITEHKRNCPFATNDFANAMEKLNDIQHCLLIL